MIRDITSIRPRNGMPAESYWRIRAWCAKNGFSFSDVYNAILIPLAYYLENFTEIDKPKSVATVQLNMGDVPIFHVRNDNILPITGKDSSEVLEEIERHIEQWKKANATHGSFVDQQIAKYGIHSKK